MTAGSPITLRLPLMMLLASLLLSACVSTSKESEDEGAGRKAAETNTALGQNYMERGQYEIALEKLKRALQHDNTYAPAHTVLAVLYETIGDSESAGKHYKEAVKYDPDDGNVNNNYAIYLCGTGKYREAEKHFNTAVQDPFYKTPGVAYANAGVCAMEQDKMDKAEQYLRQSLEFDARNGAALLPMADLSYQNGSYLRARGFLQRYESVQARTEQSLYLGYRIETALGDGNSAQSYVQALRESFPQAESLKSISQEQK